MPRKLPEGPDTECESPGDVRQAHTHMGVRWRGRLLVPGRAVAELRTPWPCLVYDDAPIDVKSRYGAFVRDFDRFGWPVTAGDSTHQHLSLGASLGHLNSNNPDYGEGDPCDRLEQRKITEYHR